MSEMTLTNLPNMFPGMYRGTWCAYTVTIHGGGRGGSDAEFKTENGIRGMSAVIVEVLSTGEAHVHTDQTAVHARKTKEEEPITPEYIKTLMEVRKTRIGPAVQAMNAELIIRLPEMAKTGSISVEVSKIIQDMPADTAELVVEVFAEKGFKVMLEADDDMVWNFIVSMP